MEKTLEELEKKIGKIEELPKEVKAIAILDFLERIMKFYNLDWTDFTKTLLDKNCPICASRIRKCLNCENPTSVGVRKCLRCGESTEKLEIEPSFP